MNASWTLVPFLFIRFVLLGLLDKKALSRAAFFSPTIGKEKIAYWFYQISNVLVFLYLFFLKIETTPPLFYIGLVIYSLGIIICVFSIFSFAKPAENGINTNGIYEISRNPMYIGYFVFFLGCVLLTRSSLLIIFSIVFQISAHWIILSEERWCIKEFGKEYISYMNKVRRYL